MIDRLVEYDALSVREEGLLDPDRQEQLTRELDEAAALAEQPPQPLRDPARGPVGGAGGPGSAR